jgi:uncharacterized RDD family membrane protein YckC
MTMTMTDARWGLPDPEVSPELYADVPLKRLVAWIVDFVVIAVLTAIVVPFTFFTGLFFLPVLFLFLGFLYRWATIATGSATWGMRLAAIEFRDASGARLDSGTAFLHTLGYTVSVSVFPLQLVSIVLMLISDRRQGLTDHVLGTAALNRRASA